MKFFAIADTNDTLVGLRLAGIEGVKVKDKQETQAALTQAIENPEIAVVLIAEKIAKFCPEQIYDMKLKSSDTLVVEIPDRHGTGRSPDSITKFIREAIGIKI